MDRVSSNLWNIWERITESLSSGEVNVSSKISGGVLCPSVVLEFSMSNSVSLLVSSHGVTPSLVLDNIS